MAGARGGKKSGAAPRRGALDLVLLAVCGTALFYFGPRTYEALRIALASASAARVDGPESLAAAKLGGWRRASVRGVPDYDRMVEGEGGARYFRVAAVPEGLLVRASGVSAPADLGALLEPREFSGPTRALGDLPEGASVAEKFKARHRLRVPPGTPVLLDGERFRFPYAEAALAALALLGFAVLVERRAAA